MRVKIFNKNCLDLLRTMPDNLVDSIVTDPPYGWKFMNKKWDYDVPSVEIWRECLRVLKPGGHILVACGTRTQHRMAINIEDAGFEIRDVVMWIYGSGFPKSLDVSKSLDKMAGVERRVIGQWKQTGNAKPMADGGGHGAAISNSSYAPDTILNITAPTSEQAQKWSGWGTALKPACELWTLARKPLDQPNVAKNVLKWGTGAINIDGCRVKSELPNIRVRRGGGAGRLFSHLANVGGEVIQHSGRWPANVIHDGSEEVLLYFPEVKTRRATNVFTGPTNGVVSWDGIRGNRPPRGYNEDGSAARFFYTSKASKGEREAGLSNMPKKRYQYDGRDKLCETPAVRCNFVAQNHHPTVKPVALMKYLCRLITPPNGVVLDPFMGSGSTGIGAVLEGFRFIGVDIDPAYCEISRKRIQHWQSQKN